MIALHLWQEKEIKFVIRGKDSMNIIKSFLSGGKTNDIVEIRPSRENMLKMLECGYGITKETSLKVRLVRIEMGKTVKS